MTTGSMRRESRRLRAPREDRAALVDPPLEEAAALVEANVSRREAYRYDLQGRCLSEVAEASRRQLLIDARRWTSQYRDVDWDASDPSTPIFLAGHQPQLLHPGVWFKNFALGTLARQHGAVGVNLLIDSDALRTTNVRVPGGTVAEPHVAEIPMDRAAPVMPYEERAILDRATFAAFGHRVVEEMAGLVADPLVRDFWPMVLKRSCETDKVGACLAQARHQLEGRWGLETLEVPQSWVCRAEAHGWFVAHLLARLPRLQRVYNEVVDEYRRVNRIRSKAHPVPNLAGADGWLEAPFWIWTADDPRRRRLFARAGRDGITLSDRHACEVVLPLTADGDAGRAVARLAELAAEGVHIRCRALLTTLWARLALGDLFLHGIGGAKYDQVTDALLERFFGLEPPDFLVLSATLHLPVVRESVKTDALRAMEHRLRRLTYHPECYMNGREGASPARDAQAAELIASKARWIEMPSTPTNARTRYEAIRRINDALAPYVAPLRERVLEERERAARAVRAEAVLAAREYGFCLYPEKTLREFLFALLPKSAQIGFDSG